MNRAQRLLALACQTYKRGEAAIAGRIALLAFEDPNIETVLQELSEAGDTLAEVGAEEVRDVEDALRRAEAATKGSIFTNEGVDRLLAIAEKVHKAGFPKVANSIVRAAS